MKYIRKLEKDRVISSDQASDDGLPVEALMTHHQELVEDVVINRLMIEKLMGCVEELLENEQELIRELFYYKNCMRDTAKKLNLSLGAVQRGKASVLRKLKRILENV